MTTEPKPRQHAAALIRRHFSGALSLEDLIRALQVADDPLIKASLFLVLQQPKRGFFGVTPGHWDKVYWPRVLYVLEQLEAGDAGVAPPAPLYPVATPLRLIGILLMILLFTYGSVDYALQVYRHATGVHLLSKVVLWERSLFAVLYGWVALRGVSTLRYRFRLFHQWRGFIFPSRIGEISLSALRPMPNPADRTDG